MTKPQPIPLYIAYILKVIGSCVTLSQLTNAKIWAYNFCSRNKPYKDFWQLLHKKYHLQRKIIRSL